MTDQVVAFALVALGLVLTPGPNMIYLISRSICQGRTAGLVSLAGTGLGFMFYMLCAAFGLTAIALALPLAYDVLRIAGAAYLFYLAWQTLRSGGRSPFELRSLPDHQPLRLFWSGFTTNLLNPKVALLYVTLLPQFITPDNGSVLTQSLLLGSTQIVISLIGNAVVVLCAASIAGFLTARPVWMRAQRWVMGGVLGGLAVAIIAEPRR